MIQLEKQEIISYQIGVDVLGMPIYHHHIINYGLIIENKIQKAGKNQTKNKTPYKRVWYVKQNQSRII